jgi:hypothetical protein
VAVGVATAGALVTGTLGAGCSVGRAGAGIAPAIGTLVAVSSAARRISICASPLACSSARAVILCNCISSASSRTRISVTAVVEGAAVVAAVVAGACVPGAICGSKNLPSPPGKTLRCNARTSASTFFNRASAALSCAAAGTGAVATVATVATISDAPARRRVMFFRRVVMARQAPWQYPQQRAPRDMNGSRTPALHRRASRVRQAP